MAFRAVHEGDDLIYGPEGYRYENGDSVKCDCEFKPYGVIEVDDVEHPVHSLCGREVDLNRPAPSIFGNKSLARMPQESPGQPQRAPEAAGA